MTQTKHTRFTILIIVAISLMAGSDAGFNSRSAAATEADSAAHTSVSVSDDLTTEQRDLVDWALSRYERAGIALPDVALTFHDTSAGCSGNHGLYVRSPREVRICRMAERTIIHELAHAWIETTFDEDHRQDFMDHRGLESWAGTGVEWRERGAEQAAEVLTWGLMEDNMQIEWIETTADSQEVSTYRLVKIPDSSAGELIAAYELLTGHMPTDRLADDPRLLTSFEPAISIVGGSPEARSTVLDAVSRFVTTGLALPDIDFRIHDDFAGCDGNHGLFHRDGDHGVIDLCADRQLLALHEISHAWERFTLNDNDRAAFVEVSEAEAWRGNNIAHHRRGTEIAADNMSYALLTHRGLGLRTRPLELFEAITGIESPRIAERAADAAAP